MARKRLVAGNWKMNLNPKEAKAFAAELAPKLDTNKADVVFCVPSIDITEVLCAVKQTKVCVGAQNMHFEDSGAYTGETSALMIKGVGATHVVIGHSERREYFGETDEIVNKKVLKAIEHGIVPIICCGETLIQREQGITIDLVRTQVKVAMAGIKQEDALQCVIAYEPIWAIGTGKTATSQQAEEVCKAIRECVKEIYCDKTADTVRVLYGGSVSAKNAAELFAMENIDGGLVGGASLKAEFEQVVNA